MDWIKGNLHRLPAITIAEAVFVRPQMNGATTVHAEPPSLCQILVGAIGSGQKENDMVEYTIIFFLAGGSHGHGDPQLLVVSIA
jgi:hypothetical protein